MEELMEGSRMIQKVDVSKSWSLVTSVLDNGHMNEMGMVGEMESIFMSLTSWVPI